MICLQAGGCARFCLITTEPERAFYNCRFLTALDFSPQRLTLMRLLDYFSRRLGRGYPGAGLNRVTNCQREKLLPTLSFDQPCGLRVWESELCRRDFNIHQGFCCSPMEECDDSFRFAALIDCNRLFELFSACLPLVGDESFFVLEYYPQQVDHPVSEIPTAPTVFYSPYMASNEIMTLLQPYFSRLVHDGFVGFGLANSRQGAELFYSEEKAFTCFTRSNIRAMHILTRIGLPQCKELLFPADFAHDHFSLTNLDRLLLPPQLQQFDHAELDYVNYCAELVEIFDMQSTTASDDFFLSGGEQDQIARLLQQHEYLDWNDEDEFVHLMMDWKEFVRQCSQGFNGSIEDYALGLKLRDIIEFVMENSGEVIRAKLVQFIADADEQFRQQLENTSKPFSTVVPDLETDSGVDARSARRQRFWRWGVTRNQGVNLRRDLIRSGWFGDN